MVISMLCQWQCKFCHCPCAFNYVVRCPIIEGNKKIKGCICLTTLVYDDSKFIGICHFFYPSFAKRGDCACITWKGKRVRSKNKPKHEKAILAGICPIEALKSQHTHTHMYIFGGTDHAKVTCLPCGWFHESHPSRNCQTIGLPVLWLN